MSKGYKAEQQYLDIERTKELLTELPSFCSQYFEERSVRLAAKSQFSYANKMKIFLQFLHDNYEQFSDRSLCEYTLDDMHLVDKDIAIKFTSFIRHKKARPNSSVSNKKSTVENYLACLSSYWTFFCRNFGFMTNPFQSIERSKNVPKEIVYMHDNEQILFLKTLNTGDGLTKRSKSYHEKNLIRQICICQILLDTGIRVSELVGLDVRDVDLVNCLLTVQRKGDKPDTVYFSDVTKDIIEEYLACRPGYHPADDEPALFVTPVGQGQGRRLSVRSVQRLVKKCAAASNFPNCENITVHRIRASYAMNLLDATHDIALVSSALGHESILTTQAYARTKKDELCKNRNIFYSGTDKI